MLRVRLAALGMCAALMFAFGAGVYLGVSERHSGLVSAAGATVTLGGQTAEPAGTDFSMFWQAWNLLEENFIQTHASGTLPSGEERLWGAIGGLAASYGDPYTVFLPPKEAERFNDDIRGSFSGVGMELGARDGMLTVVSPLKGSPAERAGVRSGDIIVGIDGTPSRTMPVEQAVERIRGPKGTTVVLTLERAGKEHFEVAIVRDIINIPILSTERVSDIFIIRLHSFSQTSTTLFRSALREHFESGATKLILDLRGNPGGYLEASVDMASYFLPVGEVVVTEDFAGKRAGVVHRSFGYNVFSGKKLAMAVLTDQGSASASEILAGALRAHGVAVLVGEQTFGKGSVQQLIELGGGAEIKITVARWLTPDGTNLSAGGLIPDIAAQRTPEDAAAGRDPQFDAAVAWLATQ